MFRYLNHRISILVSVAIIIAVVTFAFGGFFIYQHYLNSQTPMINVQNPNIQTADWKTYKNTIYGYSLKYPTNWEVGSVPVTWLPSNNDNVYENNIVSPGSNLLLKLEIYKKDPNLDYRQAFKNYSNINSLEYRHNFKETDGVINGTNVSKIDYCVYREVGLFSGCTQDVSETYIATDNKLFVFSYEHNFRSGWGKENSPSQEYITIANNIINTFIYSGIQSTELQTYANNEYGFTMQYPQSFTLNCRDSLGFEVKCGIADFHYDNINFASGVKNILPVVNLGGQDFFSVGVDKDVKDEASCQNESLERSFAEHGYKEATIGKIMVINGETFYRYNYNDGLYPGYVYFGNHSNECFVMMGFSQDLGKIDQMAKTFKFTK